MFDDCYAGKRVFLTGHDSFKGSWMSLWLKAVRSDGMQARMQQPQTIHNTTTT